MLHPLKDRLIKREHNPLVSISCITFNHSAFIKEALDGFLMQETSFEVEILIHDDASADGTQEIIKEYQQKYPTLIFPVYQSKNQYNQGVRGMHVHFNFPRARGKYIALCEGDDYWIDLYKLQKQVDFLENNNGYGVVFTDFDNLIDKNNKTVKSYNSTLKKRIPTGSVFSEILYKNPYVTCTAMFGKVYMDNYNYEFEKNDIPVRDYCLWLHIAANSKVGYLNYSTAVYRVLERSASHTPDLSEEEQFIESRFKIAKFFSDIYFIPFDEKKARYNIEKSKIRAIIVKKRYKELVRFNHRPFLILALIIYNSIYKNLIRLFK
jgi:glycosyltransferase involved in cell wall biosynthesis